MSRFSFAAPFATRTSGRHAALPCFARIRLLVVLVLVPALQPALAAAQSDGPRPRVQVQEFLTSGDRTEVLQPRLLQAEVAPDDGDQGVPKPIGQATIVVDPLRPRQTVRGFGYTLTQGSAELLQQMSPESRHSLLEEFYGDGPGALHLSELRLSIGSTDLTQSLYTLDDIPWWQTDPEMRHFSLQQDRATVLPIVHEILAIRPGIHVSAAPWTAPLWMKEPLPGNRFSLLNSDEFFLHVVQAVLPLLLLVALAALTVALLRRQSRPGMPSGIAAAAFALSLVLVWRYHPLHDASPLVHPMVSGGGHVAGLTASTLADGAMWPRGRWYPGYWPAYAQMFWHDYQDSCVLAWSGVRTMVTNGRDWTGGQLRRDDYAAYALYLTRYLQAMRMEGVPVGSMTVQNESEPNRNRPSMGWNAEQQNIFVRDYLGPALQRARVAVQITAYDHNADHIAFPLRMLSDHATNRLLTGSSFHLYGGDISNLSVVHNRFPDKDIFFTEQMVIEDTRRGVPWPAAEPVERIFVGALRNWSRSVLLWNLASDAEAGPHVLGGGCPACLGAVTITGDAVTRNLGYIVMAQVARFVPEGSVVLSSNAAPALGNVAVRTPDGHMVMVVTNLNAPKDFAVVCGAVRFRAHLNSGSVATFVWPA